MNNRVVFIGFILMIIGVIMSFHGLEVFNYLPYCVEGCEDAALWGEKNFYIGMGIGFSAMLIVIGGMFQDNYKQSI